MLEAVLGSVSAERTLLYLQSYGEGHARAIAKTFGMRSHTQISKQLKKLEDGGFLVSRSIGRTRVYSWNERNPLVPDLRRLLQSTLEVLPKREVERHYRQRRRPRRAGKPS